MPKLKTRKSAKKRFKATGSGKIQRRHSHGNHLLFHKSMSRRRRMESGDLVHERDEDNVRLMLPYLSKG
jgi:large subunit ribosomal protein L35